MLKREKNRRKIREKKKWKLRGRDESLSGKVGKKFRWERWIDGTEGGKIDLPDRWILGKMIAKNVLLKVDVNPEEL